MTVKILVFGDSIGCGYYDNKGGWVTRLKEYSAGKNGPRVVNLSIDGYDTDQLLGVFRDEVVKQMAGSETVVVIALGLNDSATVNSTGQMIVPPLDFNRNINRLIREGRDLTPHLIFIGLTPVVDEKLTSWKDEMSYSMRFVEEYDAVVRNICRHEHVPFISLIDCVGREDIHDDGFHPGPSGHGKIFEKVRNILEKRKLL